MLYQEKRGGGQARFLSGQRFTGCFCGFTLAEVLITLGVIGIVAAMTLPTLIQKQRFMILQNQLKKAMSVHSQAMLQTKAALGIDNFNETFTQYDAVNNVYPYKDRLYQEYLKYTKVSGTCEYKNPPRNYNNTNDAYIDIGARTRPMYLAPDGTCFEITINASTIGVTVDVNGADKRPNQLGHDMFVFYVNNKDFLVPMKVKNNMSQEELDELPDRNPDDAASSGSASGIEQSGWPCTSKNNQKGNGMGCAWYALQDICPDDPTKKYWQCLP